MYSNRNRKIDLNSLGIYKAHKNNLFSPPNAITLVNLKTDIFEHTGVGSVSGSRQLKSCYNATGCNKQQRNHGSSEMHPFPRFLKT